MESLSLLFESIHTSKSLAEGADVLQLSFLDRWQLRDFRAHYDSQRDEECFHEESGQHEEPSRPEELRHLLDESRARIDEARRVNSDLQVRSSDEVVLRTLARHLELDLAEHAILETRYQESQRMDWMEEGYVTSTFDSDSDSSATSDDEVTVEDVDREVAAEPDRNSDDHFVDSVQFSDPLPEPQPEPQLDPQQSSSQGPSEPIKMCRECKASKTPQWRNGPEGQKELCNACGTRYLRRQKRERDAQQNSNGSESNRKKRSSLDSPSAQIIMRTRAAQREFETQLQEQQSGIQEEHNQDETQQGENQEEEQEEEQEQEENQEEPTQNEVEIPGLNPNPSDLHDYLDSFDLNELNELDTMNNNGINQTLNSTDGAFGQYFFPDEIYPLSEHNRLSAQQVDRTFGHTLNGQAHQSGATLQSMEAPSAELIYHDAWSQVDQNILLTHQREQLQGDSQNLGDMNEQFPYNYNMPDAGILMPYPSGIIEVNRNVQSGYPWSSNLVMRHSELSDSSTWCEYPTA